MMKEDGGESLETRKNVYVSCGIKEMKWWYPTKENEKKNQKKIRSDECDVKNLCLCGAVGEKNVCNGKKGEPWRKERI